jgi:hypothetical protein
MTITNTCAVGAAAAEAGEMGLSGVGDVTGSGADLVQAKINRTAPNRAHRSTV